MGRTFETTIDIDKELFERLNKLLSIEDLSDCDEDVKKFLGAKEDDDIPLFEVGFEGTEDRLFLNVRSGGTNYYDDCWVDRYENGEFKDSIVFDCSYELEETMEFYVDDDTYDDTTYIIHFNCI